MFALQAFIRKTDSFMLRVKVTLSVIFTKRLKPSEDLSIRRPEMLWQKSLALVLDSTSNTCEHKQLLIYEILHAYKVPKEWNYEEKCVFKANIFTVVDYRRRRPVYVNKCPKL